MGLGSVARSDRLRGDKFEKEGPPVLLFGLFQILESFRSKEGIHVSKYRGGRTIAR